MLQVTPADIRFAADGSPPRSVGACPGCGDPAPKTPVLSVPALNEPARTLDLLRCGACGTLRFDPPGVQDFADFGARGDEFWRFYVEAGGGVWETIWPILVARGSGSLLDVGCGFGFALDFWRRDGRGEAVGVELAAYGQAGAAAFGVAIHDRLLGDCPAVDGRRFDVVYASEVIEHVPDPRAFAALLAGYVADDGVLALTTPAASYVAPANLGPTLLAALAPGFHGFLLSERAFADAARAAGFDHVATEVQGERQFLWASRRPFALDRRLDAHRDAVNAYLHGRFDDPLLDPVVRRGYGYRLLRDHVNLGRWPEAVALHERLQRQIVADFGPGVLDPVQTLPRLEASDDLEGIGAVGPYFLPAFHYLSAVIAQVARRDPATADRQFDAAERTALACARVGTSYFLESVDAIWPSRLQRASIRLVAGDDAVAADLAAAADRFDAPDERLDLVAPTHAQIDAWLPPAAEYLWSVGRHAPASVIAGAYARYVARRYGGAWATLAGAVERLADPGADLPGEPLFPAWGRALEGLGEPATAARARVEAAAIIAAARAHATHATRGPRLAAFAQRAEAILRAGDRMAPPASRNDPCPCGSGRRYKACHGAAAAAPGRPPS